MSAYTQTWFVDGSILGSAPCNLERTHNQLHSPRQYAFCCPLCGEVWARRIISPSTPWFFWTRPCSRCGDPRSISWDTPGSVWISFDQTYLDNLPPFMLRYEALLCCTSPL